MAWYDRILEQGVIVRGTVNENTNEFYYEYTPKHELEEDGSYKKTKKGEFVYKKDKKGNLEFNKKVDRNGRVEDAYIECSSSRKGDQIFCTTALASRNKNHTFMACIYSYGRGMNVLREFYCEYLGGKEDVYKLNKKSNKMEWLDNKIVKAISLDGRIFDIEICEEVYFKMEEVNFKILSKLMKVKKSKGKAKDPFCDDYLIWNKYKIPQKDLDKYDKIKLERYGKIEFGDTKALDAGRDMNNITKSFMTKKKITKQVKMEKRVKDSKSLIHALGLWDAFIEEFANSAKI